MKTKTLWPCRNCSKNKGVGKMTKHWVECEGVKILIPRSGEFCSECINKFLEETKKLIRESGIDSGLVSVGNGGLEINWQVYINAERAAAGDKTHKIDKMSQLLRWLKIFTWQAGRKTGCWGIEGSVPFYISPLKDAGFSNLRIYQDLKPVPDSHSFIRRGDAIEYGRLKFADASFKWWVVRYGTIIHGDTILGKR